MKNSCGAILYSRHPTTKKTGIILGLERGEWTPFKGCCNEGESFVDTAIREIKEETHGLVKLHDIKLHHQFSTKNKIYHIGLVFVDYDLLENFKEEKKKINTPACYLEKEKLRFFPVDDIPELLDSFHIITRASIMFYWNQKCLCDRQDTTNTDLLLCYR